MKSVFHSRLVFQMTLLLSLGAVQNLRAEKPDPKFGTNGVVLTPVDNQAIARGTAVLSNGKIAVAGQTTDSSGTHLLVARYLKNGSLDTTFNHTGIVILPFQGNQNEDLGFTVREQSDGKLVAAGRSFFNPLMSSFVVIRLLADGTLDPQFGNGGVVLTSISGWALGVYAMTLLPDGKTLVLGQAVNFDGDLYYFLLARYLSDGSLDTTFGSSGMVLTPVTDSFPHSIVIQPDQKILVAGQFNNNDQGTFDFILQRYTSDGQLDPSFGNQGQVDTDFGTGNQALCNEIGLDPDGRIYAAGSVSFAPGGTQAPGLQMAMVRYLPNGSLDTSFGQKGQVFTAIGANAEAAGVARLSDGKYVLAGYGTVGSGLQFALVRYTESGLPDATFGKQGIATYTVGGSPAEPKAMVLDHRGILAAGFSTPASGNSEVALLRIKEPRAEVSCFPPPRVDQRH